MAIQHLYKDQTKLTKPAWFLLQSWLDGVGKSLSTQTWSRWTFSRASVYQQGMDMFQFLTSCTTWLTAWKTEIMQRASMDIGSFAHERVSLHMQRATEIPMEEAGQHASPPQALLYPESHCLQKVYSDSIQGTKQGLFLLAYHTPHLDFLTELANILFTVMLRIFKLLVLKRLTFVPMLPFQGLLRML